MNFPFLIWPDYTPSGESVQSLGRGQADNCQTCPYHERVPRNYPADHQYVSLLLHNGLYASVEMPMPAEFFSAQLLDYCHERFAGMLPMHNWLLTLTEQAAESGQVCDWKT